MSKQHYWIADEFELEFNKIKDLELPEVFKWQIEQVNKIVNHWGECRPCRLGFDLSEYSMLFPALIARLADCHIEYHICDGTYNVLRSRER